MNIDVLALRSARTDATEHRTLAATLGLVICAFSVVAAATALVVAGSDATAGHYVLPCLAIAWAVAGLVITIRQHCPAGSIVHAFAAATAVGALAWNIDTTRDLRGVGALGADLGIRLAVALTPALMFHLLMTLPDGRLARATHRRYVIAGYVIAAATGISMLAERSHVVHRRRGASLVERATRGKRKARGARGREHLQEFAAVHEPLAPATPTAIMTASARAASGVNVALSAVSIARRRALRALASPAALMTTC